MMQFSHKLRRYVYFTVVWSIGLQPSPHFPTNLKSEDTPNTGEYRMFRGKQFHSICMIWIDSVALYIKQMDTVQLIG